MYGHSGIGRYVGAFSSALSEHHELLVGVRDGRQRDEMQKEGLDCEAIIYDADIYSVREQVRGISLIHRLRDRVDLFFFPQYNAPWNLPANSVVMIYDFIQFEQEGHGSRFKKFAAWRTLSNSVRKAGRIIAISEFTRQSLANYFPSAGSKTTVIHPGVDKPVVHETDAARTAPVLVAGVAEFRRRSGIEKYLLCVGNKKPHKNFSFVKRVFDEIAGEFPSLSLVMVGKRFPGWNSPTGGRVFDLENVSDGELDDWYAGAEILLHPSLAEGFGLPPLEAMRAGVPAIVSDRGSLPEIVGDAAPTLDVTTSDPWKEEIRMLLRDREYRLGWARKGAARAREFTWKKSCAQLLEVVSESTGRFPD